MSSKLVSQPFVLESVTVVQVAVKPVVMVAIWPAVTVCVLVCPLQLMVTVVAAPPPLYALRLTSLRAVTKVKVWLVTPPPLNEALLLVRAPQGPEWYHWLVPQLMTLVGYCPLR